MGSYLYSLHKRVQIPVFLKIFDIMRQRFNSIFLHKHLDFMHKNQNFSQKIKTLINAYHSKLFVINIYYINISKHKKTPIHISAGISISRKKWTALRISHDSDIPYCLCEEHRAGGGAFNEHR